MGYLVTAHVVKEKVDFAQLRKLPASIGSRVYFHEKAQIYLVDTFRASKPSKYPFQTPLPAVDVPLDLPSSLQHLETVYDLLSRANNANGIKKSYINFSRTLSTLLNTAVFSLISDEDELDFNCCATAGELRRLKCRCGDIEVLYDGAKVQIVPLVNEDEDGEELMTDLSAIAATPGVQVLPRTKPRDTQLHAIASQDLQTFLGLSNPILGLGSFDPPDDEREWRLVAH